MGMEKYKFCVGTIPTHPHTMYLHGDMWGNVWGGFAWYSETVYSETVLQFSSEKWKGKRSQKNQLNDLLKKYIINKLLSNYDNCELVNK